MRSHRTGEKSTLNQVEFNTLANTRNPHPMSNYMLSLWNLFRLALVCTCLLFGVLVSMVCHLHRAAGGTTDTKNELSNTESPLQFIPMKDHNMAEDLQMGDALYRGTDCEKLRKINGFATLELKTLVTGETVVPYQDRGKLAAYVKQQLDASDAITEKQKCAVMSMVNLAPMEASVKKEGTGELGTLRNSAVIALFKRHLNNIHFMLIGVRAEPRLGWKWIPSAERNSWNYILSRVLYNKVHVEAQNYLQHGDPSKPSSSNPKCMTAENSPGEPLTEDLETASWLPATVSQNRRPFS